MQRFFRWFGLPGALVLTILMSLTAVVSAALRPTPDRWLRAAAMLLGSLGDIILMNDPRLNARLPKLLRGFVPGGAVFGLSHLVYIGAFLSLLHRYGYPAISGGFWLGGGLAAAVILSMLVLTCLFGKHQPVMTALWTLYLLAIGSVLTLVCSFAWQAGGWAWLLPVGSVSFIISDYFIALDSLTTKATDTTRGLVWWFYPIGQLLLVLG